MTKQALLDKVRRFSIDNEVEITVTGHRSKTWKQKRPRVFIHGEPSPEEFGIEPGGPSKKGDGSEDDKQWKVYNRAELNIMRHFLAQAERKIKEVLEAKGYSGCANNLEFGYSRYAGCSCPCSPGYVIKTLRPLHNGLNVYVNVDWKSKREERERLIRKQNYARFDPAI